MFLEESKISEETHNYLDPVNVVTATSPTTLHLLFLEPPQAIGTGPGYLCTEESNYN